MIQRNRKVSSPSKYKDEIKEKTEFIKEIKRLKKRGKQLRFSTLQKMSNTIMCDPKLDPKKHEIFRIGLE